MRYYVRTFRRRVSFQPYVILAVALYLFIASHVPGGDLPLKYMGFPIQQVESHTIKGTITTKSAETGREAPATAARVYVGGHRTSVDASGRFTLDTLIPTGNSVPLVIKRGGESTVQMVDLHQNKTTYVDIDIP